MAPCKKKPSERWPTQYFSALGTGGHEDQKFKVILLVRKSALFRRRGREGGGVEREGRREGMRGYMEGKKNTHYFNKLSKDQSS